MSNTSTRMLRGATALVVLLLALAGCRDSGRAADSTVATDSSLARDLAMAQRNDAGPLVFNDAPSGRAASVSPPSSPAPRRPREATPAPMPRPAPRPAPRRSAPPAPVEREDAAQRAATTPVQAPASSAGVIGSGTRLGLTTNGRVCAAGALAGDKFTATVTSATVGSNGATIPAGSTVVLEVASVDRADPIESSRITFRVRAIDVNGVARPAEGDVATLGALEPVRSSSGNERNKVIGGAVAGAVLGRIFGRSTKATVIGGAVGAAAGTAAARRGETSDACLPDGSALRLTLSRDLSVPRPSAF